MTDLGDGFYLFDHDLNVIKRAIGGIGVVDGLVVSGYSSAMALSVSSGIAVIESASNLKAVTQTNFTSFSITSDPTYPKKGMVYIGTNSNLTISYGTPAPADPSGFTAKETKEPYPPDAPTGSAVLAEVWIPAGATLGSSCNIFNYKMRLFGGCYITTE